MKIAFLPAAQAELDDAFSWYEEQAVGGLRGCLSTILMHQAMRRFQMPRFTNGFCSRAER
jgi:hypothetical protein